MNNLTTDLNPISPGTILPDFCLEDSKGQSFCLEEMVQTNGLVIFFIRGTWCPVCVRLLTQVNRIIWQIKNRGTGFVCIACDTPEAIFAYKISAEPPLDFPILIDSSPSLSKQYGVFDSSHESPQPAFFFADADKVIRYVDVSPIFDWYPDLEQLLTVVQQHKK